MKKNNYRIQNGCFNCKHVFVRGEYDEANTYFCALGAGKRPACGSIAMGESFYEEGSGEKIARIKWEEWSKGREVHKCGICDKYACKNV